MFMLSLFTQPSSCLLNKNDNKNSECNKDCMYIHVKCKHVCRKKNIVNVLSGLVHGLTSILSHNVPPPHVCRCASESLPVFKRVLCSCFFFFTPCTLETHPAPFHHLCFLYRRLSSSLKIDDGARGAGVITTSLLLSEPTSTELTGLFVEKPPENVVAVAGQK